VRHSSGALQVCFTHTASFYYRPLVMERKPETFTVSTWRAFSRACHRKTRSSSRCLSRPRPLASSFMTGRRKSPRTRQLNYLMKSSCPRRTVESLVSFRSPVCLNCIPSPPAGVWYLTLRLQRRTIFKTRPSIYGVLSLVDHKAQGIRQLRAIEVCSF
jgi:hypothetical protein